MLKILAPLLLVVVFASLQAAEAEKAPWMTDYQAAVTKATNEKKPLLLDFTGSDWCGWCIKLKKEVFDTQEFKEWAAKNVVLVEVDFPRGKQLDATVAKQNQELAKRFSIQGFPTIIVLDPTGKKKAGELGYEKGGPATWTSKADAVVAKAK
jgi:thioredoxin-related protein